MSAGKVIQIIGPVVDVEFPLNDELPDINTALKVKRDDGSVLVTEVALELGDGVMRTIAMDGTEGLRRGMEVENTGASISEACISSANAFPSLCKIDSFFLPLLVYF